MATLLDTSLGFLRNHWSGKNRLVPTILVTLLSITLLLRFIPPAGELAGAVAVILFINAVLIWQFVGTWRGIQRNLVFVPDTFTVWSAYGAMLLVLILTSLQSLDQITSGYSKSDSLMAIYSNRQLPVSLDGHQITITGDIDFQTYTDLIQTLDKFEKANTVVLNSEGGLVYAARALAKTILKNGLHTHVDGVCQSACTIVFAAGTNRTAANGAKLGFHQYRFSKRHPLSSVSAGEEQKTEIAFFRQRGLSENFLARAFSQPHSSIWHPTRQEMLDAGLVNRE